jgi:hypothetical protein
MANTAQQQLVDRMVAAFAGTGGFTVSSPSPGVFRAIGSRDFRVAETGPKSYIGSGAPIVGYRTSATQYDFQIPHTVAPGDSWTLKLQTLTSVLAEHTVRLESTLKYVPGGFDHNTGLSTVSPAVASDRRLVVMEAAPGRGDSGKLFAIAPDQAGGIPFPTMRVVNALPVTGTTEGETTYVMATRTAYVWSGARWMDITPSPVSMFPDDAAIKADTTLPNGTYSVASNTGNMYVRTISGWRRVGIIQVPSIANLPTDAVVGDESLTVDTGILYVRILKAGVLTWRPATIYEDTEANIRAATWAMDGTSAIATDTGRTFVRISGAWIEEPIAHYATEALLLAATPVNGTLAWSDDTAVVYTRTGGAWKRLAGHFSGVTNTPPTTPVNGDIFLSNHDPLARGRGLQIYDGTKWMSASGGGVSSLVNKYIQGAAGPIEVDLGGKDWHQINLDVMVEFRMGDEFFTLSSKTSTGAWTQWGAALKNVRAHAQKGIESKAHNIKSVAQNVDWLVLSWANNDPSFAVHDPYAHVRVKITRMYDDFLMMQTEMDYGGAGSTQIEASAFWEFDDSAPTKDIQYLVFNGYGSNVRLGMTGRLTVVE